MRRLGNSSLLSIKEALYLGAASPHCFANALYDKVFGLKDLDFPRRIILHLANRCNFACPMCSIGVARADRQKDYVGDTPFEIVQKAIEEAGQHGTYVELLGGEPTLYSKHCCPARSRIESVDWRLWLNRFGSLVLAGPVKWAFFRKA
jgi:sulfatase maturation enzyme AslB (radical SAM superfamily)